MVLHYLLPTLEFGPWWCRIDSPALGPIDPSNEYNIRKVFVTAFQFGEMPPPSLCGPFFVEEEMNRFGDVFNSLGRTYKTREEQTVYDSGSEDEDGAFF
mmetsp:Transcript_34016/g.46557  ORF Transcript_34016/g.46557 Transcript_34016/m.46557 type:complete len:99 (+) Transcript_34016:245-541(+)